ncbi:hypothetical protein AK812_SmicGene11551 [Symbiodinium microadriaticum]|uniref:SCP domain-containing protein n=1 Tax=Symbiodinium microadriaticum TaxID=2951 RepID=A0A1Q9ED10_SYMMI|nr:hypothetical protein AK812_SmicGene11551 [Symbiodinium microadriaticum]
MGTGASATIAETAKSVSDDDLKAAFKDVSAADRMRIAAAAVDGIDQYGAVADGGGVKSPGLPEAPADWIKECLDCHNKFRANHGVPALEWSHECYEFALLQAEACQANGKISHGSQQGGNVTNEGYYKENIPAPRADMWAKLMAVEDYLEDVKKAFDKKGKVTVDRQGNDVKIVIEVGDVINELNGSW